MFNSNKTQNTNSIVNDNFSANTIQSGTIIDGHIKSEGSIRIDGILNGSITTKGKLVIGKSGVITGDVFCKNASVEGKVEGKVEVEDVLDLKATAVLEGDIFTSKLIVQPGAVFNGNCKMGHRTKESSISEKGSFEHKKAV